MHVLKVKEEDSRIRLDVFLAKNLPDLPSRSFVKKLIDTGNVIINDKPAKANHKVHLDEEVQVTIPEDLCEPDNIEPEDIPLDIVYEDQCLIVVNKPNGLLVHPAQGIYTGTLVNALLHHCDKLSDVNAHFRPGIVHRLDQETSGLIVVAKDNETHRSLAKQFQKRTVYKRYIAVVEGAISFDEGHIDAPIGRHPRYRDKKAVVFDDGAKQAQTFYKVLKRANNRSLVALVPKTGRTHQLRVHMAYQRHPILGDEKYGKKGSFDRLALHAQSLGIMHPLHKSYLEFTTVFPDEFLALVQ